MENPLWWSLSSATGNAIIHRMQMAGCAMVHGMAWRAVHAYSIQSTQYTGHSAVNLLTKSLVCNECPSIGRMDILGLAAGEDLARPRSRLLEAWHKQEWQGRPSVVHRRATQLLQDATSTLGSRLPNPLRVLRGVSYNYQYLYLYLSSTNNFPLLIEHASFPPSSHQIPPPKSSQAILLCANPPPPTT